MSVLIKASGDAHSVQAFAPRLRLAEPVPEASPAPAAPAEDPRLAVLRQDNAELKKALASLRDTAPLVEAKAREAGKREALAASKRDDEKRIELLAAGIAAAAESCNEKLDGLEALAALMTRTALAKLFDGSEDYAELVIRMIARQVRVMRREAILAIRVSTQDFADEAALARMRQGAGTGATAITADPDLPAGECRLDLQLGHLDLGVRSQWGLLSELLEKLADEEPRP